jgi:putative glycosyltransferase
MTMPQVRQHTGDSETPAISIVSTLYMSAEHLNEFYQRARRAAEACVGDDYEILLVNDGSPDNSLELAVALATADAHLSVIDLSRNFGHHKAMMTGLAHARGKLIFLIDSDMEEEPELLSAFSERLRREKADVIYGVQESRKGKFFERWTGRWFYSIFNALTGLGLPENISVVRLMTRRYVEALLRHDEREIFFVGLCHIAGFDQRPQPIVKLYAGKSTYSIRRKLSLLVNSITSFSNAPLYAIFYTGSFISIIAAAGIAYLLVRWLFLDMPPDGWTSVMASVWLIGGLIMSFVGIIGIYLAKVFSETKKRPYTIVRHIYKNDTL